MASFGPSGGATTPAFEVQDHAIHSINIPSRMFVRFSYHDINDKDGDVAKRTSTTTQIRK